jgi:hypothetical protein
MWLSVFVAVLALLLYVHRLLRTRNILKENKSLQWVAPLFELIWTRLSVIFQSGWIIRLIKFFSNLIQRMIAFMNGILEGDGGLLWAIVLLILFLSVIRSI